MTQGKVSFQEQKATVNRGRDGVDPLNLVLTPARGAQPSLPVPSVSLLGPWLQWLTPPTISGPATGRGLPRP